MTSLHHFVLGVSTADLPVVVLIVGARLFVPLLFPRYPLLIVAILLLDSADQTLFDRLTDLDVSETSPYQSVDKALDIYYLSIAYLTTLRNWTSGSAFRVAQFLFYYRLVGVALFEQTDERILLLVFPNTFEYFFIFYELVRLRFDPSRLSARFWVMSAAAIWVFIKIPHEYWIHVAKLDFTDAVRENPGFGAAIVLAVVVAAFVLVRVVFPRLPDRDWDWRFAADPIPSSLADAHARWARRLREGRVFSMEALEKVCLLTLLCLIFALILPGIEATGLQVAAAVTAIVIANAVISLSAARHEGFGLETAAARYAALLVANLGLVWLCHAMLSERREFDLGYGLFFAYLLTTIIWLYDAFRPVLDQRAERRNRS